MVWVWVKGQNVVWVSDEHGYYAVQRLCRDAI